MQRDQCKVGMTVSFGRENGEKTVGVVEKCNPKKAKVRTTEARGATPAGTLWNVPYSLLHADGVEAPAFPIGLTIRGIREMSPSEKANQGWDGFAMAIELSDGSVLYPSQDYEGNGPGAFFGRLRTGEHFTVG